MTLNARLKSCAAAAAMLLACLLLPGNQAKAEASPIESAPAQEVAQSAAPAAPQNSAAVHTAKPAAARAVTLANVTAAQPAAQQTASQSAPQEPSQSAPQAVSQSVQSEPQAEDITAEEAETPAADEEENAITKATHADVEAPDDLVKFGDFIATAYCVTGQTSTGTQTTVGRTLAVNPYVIPYGTEIWLYLEDGTFVGDFIAEDTGSNMMANPNVIDIYMGQDSYHDCILWGAQNVQVYVRSTSEAASGAE